MLPHSLTNNNPWLCRGLLFYCEWYIIVTLDKLEKNAALQDGDKHLQDGQSPTGLLEYWISRFLDKQAQVDKVAHSRRVLCGRGVVTMWWWDWSDAPCTRHAPFGDVQDANEMRTVEDAKWNENYVGISG